MQRKGRRTCQRTKLWNHVTNSIEIHRMPKPKQAWYLVPRLKTGQPRRAFVGIVDKSCTLAGSLVNDFGHCGGAGRHSVGEAHKGRDKLARGLECRNGRHTDQRRRGRHLSAPDGPTQRCLGQGPLRRRPRRPRAPDRFAGGELLIEMQELVSMPLAFEIPRRRQHTVSHAGQRRVPLAFDRSNRRGNEPGDSHGAFL